MTNDKKEVHMKRHQKILWTAIFCMVLFIFACVTINIYFPAEQVESVAGDIVDEIRDRKPADKDKQLEKKDSSIRAIWLAMWPSIVFAQDAVNVSNPTIRALKEKLKARYGSMKPFYQKGILKEGDNGYVSVGSTGGLGLKEKRDLKSLVEAENKDRKSLYEEVAKALEVDPAHINKVAEIFAKEWQK